MLYGKSSNNEREKDGHYIKTQRRIEVELTDELRANIQGYEGEEVVFGIRPEDIHIDGPIVEKYPNSQADIECDVVELLGHELILL